MLAEISNFDQKTSDISADIANFYKKTSDIISPGCLCPADSWEKFNINEP